MRSGVLEVDRTPAHLGDDFDLLARGQSLRTGEELALPDVTVLGEGDRGDACDVCRVDQPHPACTRRVDDLALSDGVEPPEGVRHEVVGPQVGRAKAGLAHDLLASCENGPDEGPRLQARAETGG